jgi:hypothetical protein
MLIKESVSDIPDILRVVLNYRLTCFFIFMEMSALFVAVPALRSPNILMLNGSVDSLYQNSYFSICIHCVHSLHVSIRFLALSIMFLPASVLFIFLIFYLSLYFPEFPFS